MRLPKRVAPVGNAVIAGRLGRYAVVNRGRQADWSPIVADPLPQAPTRPTALSQGEVAPGSGTLERLLDAFFMVGRLRSLCLAQPSPRRQRRSHQQYEMQRRG